jgi:hypothetical protein
VNALIISGTTLFAGTWGGSGIYRSTDNGLSWTSANFGLTNNGVHALAVSDTNLFAGTSIGVFRSTDNGSNWTKKSYDLDFETMSLCFLSTNLFAGTYNGGVFLSTDYGVSWTSANSGMSGWWFTALVVSGMNIFAARAYDDVHGGGGVFISTNTGISWATINDGLPHVNNYVLAVSGAKIFVGTYNDVLFSINNGSSWISTNLTYGAISFAVSDTFLFAGTSGDGIWKRPLSEMVTTVKDNENNIPMRFSLSQNFPNPFNPSTTISFTLPSKSFVSLKVFDMLGREVATIISEIMTEGTYSRQWNAGNKPSGVYFYCLQTDSFTETKKLVLVK